MKTINQEEFQKINRVMHDLEDLLACMGIKEFSLSRERHNIQIDTNADNIDTDLLYTFCRDIEQIHFTKFGSDTQNRAA